MHTTATYLLFCEIAERTDHSLFVFPEHLQDTTRFLKFLREACGIHKEFLVSKHHHMIVAATVAFHTFYFHTLQSTTNMVHAYRSFLKHLYGECPTTQELRNAMGSLGNDRGPRFGAYIYQQYLAYLDTSEIREFNSIMHYAIMVSLVAMYFTSEHNEDTCSIFVGHLTRIPRNLSKADWKMSLLAFDGAKRRTHSFEEALGELPQVKTTYTSIDDRLLQLALFTECFARYMGTKRKFCFVEAITSYHSREPEYDPLVHPFLVDLDAPHFLLIPFIVIDEQDIPTYATILAESVSEDLLSSGISLSPRTTMRGYDMTNK